MRQLRPKFDQVVRQMVERAVEVPEAQEVGALETEFRGTSVEFANEVRQAGIAGREKGDTSGVA